MFGDGHTRLTLPVDPNAGFFTGHTPTPMPADPALRFRHMPVRYFAYDDGLFITAAARPELAGKRVLRLGALSAEEAMKAAMAVVEGDNEMGRRMNAANALAVFEVLEALGIGTEVTLEGGETVTLEPVPFGEPAPWLPKPDARPVHFEARDGIVVLTSNEIVNLGDVLEPLMAAVEQNEALVIDLRANPGGNGAYNRALVHVIIRNRKLREPGRLFVLIGRRTFSAALFLLLDLEQNTNAVFVGEPTGARPNGWGDSRKLLLPSSGLTVRVSTLYWQKSDPRDDRDAFAPDVAAPPARGRDAAMDEVRRIVGAFRRKGGLAGEWAGVARFEQERFPVRVAGDRVLIDKVGPATTLRLGDGVLAGVARVNGLEFPFFARRTRP